MKKHFSSHSICRNTPKTTTTSFLCSEKFTRWICTGATVNTRGRHRQLSLLEYGRSMDLYRGNSRGRHRLDHERRQAGSTICPLQGRALLATDRDSVEALAAGNTSFAHVRGSRECWLGVGRTMAPRQRGSRRHAVLGIAEGGTMAEDRASV